MLGGDGFEGGVCGEGVVGLSLNGMKEEMEYVGVVWVEKLRKDCDIICRYSA